MEKDDEIEAARAELETIRRELGEVGLLSHGYVQDRGPGAGGPCYQWTRKVKAKLGRMEELSRVIIFGTMPDTRRSKRPSKATLGLGKRPKSP